MKETSSNSERWKGWNPLRKRRQIPEGRSRPEYTFAYTKEAQLLADDPNSAGEVRAVKEFLWDTFAELTSYAEVGLEQYVRDYRSAQKISIPKGTDGHTVRIRNASSDEGEFSLSYRAYKGKDAERIVLESYTDNSLRVFFDGGKISFIKLRFPIIHPDHVTDGEDALGISAEAVPLLHDLAQNHIKAPKRAKGNYTGIIDVNLFNKHDSINVECPLLFIRRQNSGHSDETLARGRYDETQNAFVIKADAPGKPEIQLNVDELTAVVSEMVSCIPDHIYY